MNQSVLVSIYIYCHNYDKYLSKSIESVINQTYKNWELILINDASTDKTLSIFKKYQKKLKKKIKLINQQTFLGLQKSANQALRVSNGDYIMRLDADDWLLDNAVLNLIWPILDKKKYEMIYGNYFYVSENGDIIDYHNHSFGEIGSSHLSPPHGACTLIKTKSLKRNKGYSEIFKAQDGWDIWYKIAKSKNVLHLSMPLFFYRKHSTSISSNKKRILKNRNNIIKKIISSKDGDYQNKVLAIIPVKSSYQNFKNVEKIKIKDQSILEIGINNASSSKQITDILVTSSSPKVINFSKSLEKNKITPSHLRLLRNKEENDNFIPFNDIISSSIDYYKKIHKTKPDIIVFLSLTNLSHSNKIFDQALNKLRLDNSDSIVSVNVAREPIFKLERNGLKLVNQGKFEGLSLRDDKLFEFNGSLIAFWHDNINQYDSFLGKKISYLEMDPKDFFKINIKQLSKKVSK